MSRSLDNAANDAIDYGDAVEVVKWPCCGYKLGHKFIVNAMEKPRSGFLRCVKCGAHHETSLDALGPSADWNPVSWLKKIERTADIPQGTRLG